MSLHILIPCKSLWEGKSRLAAVLSPRERQELCAHLLERTLRLALALGTAASIRTITPDPEACMIAAMFGVGALKDEGTGLNDALEAARDVILREAGEHSSALILPIDLPCATVAAIRRATASAVDVAISPDAANQGTNLLFLVGRALGAFPFAFGPGSYSRHRRAAEDAGLRVAIVDDPLLAFDIDRPEDWRRWRGTHPIAAGGAIEGVSSTPFAP